MRHLLVQIAISLIGVPYIWAGQSITGMDCSGMVIYLRRLLGLGQEDLTAAMMYDRFQPVPEDEAQPGDLAFYAGKDGSIIHVDILIGHGKVIGAQGGNRKCTTVEYARMHNASVTVSNLHRSRRIAGFRKIPNIDKEVLTSGKK